MKRLMLLFGITVLLTLCGTRVALSIYAQTLTISPSEPVVPERGIVQFTTNRPATWTLAPGSAGSIDASGVYTAPASVVVKQKAGPCQLLPPDHIFNTRVDSLPVHSSNAALMGLFSSSAAQKLVFSPSFGTNLITNDIPTTDMRFVYTPGNNGLFQVPTWDIFPGLKVESGVFVRPFQSPGVSNFDRHLISVNRDTCQLSDLYNPYNVGDNPAQCPTCNAQSGVTYPAITFALPTTGATDAAGLAQQPVSLRLSDILSGTLTHALRFTLPNIFIKPSYQWPATANAVPYCTGSPCWEYGLYVRLKDSYDINGFSPLAQVILKGLKQYGMILADGGLTWDIQTDTDVMIDPAARAAIGEVSGVIVGKDNLEIVDTSSLKVAGNSGAVSLGNGYVTPTQFAEVIATDSQMRTARTRIALQGITVSVPEDAITIAAGHEIQLSAWVKGTNTQTVTWSMSPELGTLNSDGLYTAPSTVTAPTSIVITAASTMNAAAKTAIKVTVWPFSDHSIRIDAGGDVDYTDSDGRVWYRDGYSQFESGITGVWSDSVGWPADTPAYYFQQRYHYADSVYKWRLPNGNYKVTLYMGIGFGTGPILTTDYQCHLESQGQLAKRYYSTARATGGMRRVPGSVSIPMQVTNGIGYFAQRHLDGPNGFCNVAAIEVAPDTESRHIEIDTADSGDITIGQVRQFYSVGWYMPNSVSWSVVTGPGAIDSNGRYTAPLTPPLNPVMVTVRATSTEDNTQIAESSFQFVFGVIVVSPQAPSVPRGLAQQFTASIGGVPYHNVTWEISSNVGVLNADGLYVAPLVLGSNVTATVTATSRDDPSRSGSATLTVLKSINPIRVNCGATLESQAFTDARGRRWSVDYGYSTPSQSYSNNNPIQNTTPDMYPLYQSSRYRYPGETFSYSFAVPIGTYRVTLKWAEHRTTNQGMKMDVMLEGNKVLSNFDPVAAAGGINIAYDRSFSVIVVDGSLDLTFIGRSNATVVGASINGIEIMEENPLGASAIRGAMAMRNTRIK